MKSVLSALVVAGLILGMAAPAAASDGYFKRWLQYVRAKIEQYYEVNPREIDWKHGPAAAVPEPSSALVFGAGLLVASQIARRRRR